jgi:hypothetical protein
LAFFWTNKPWFLTEGKFATVLIIPSSWGSQLDGYPARIISQGALMNKPDNSDESRGQLTAGIDTFHLLQIQSPWT